MLPEYEQRRPNKGDAGVIASTRLTKDVYETLQAIARLEGDNVSGLVLEGIMRVMDARADPTYAEQLEQFDAKANEQRHKDSAILKGML